MGDKSVQKKEYIVEKARKVFITKGYKDVTMKDIVEACDISRGGLYIYFESTEALFVEVLRAEASKGDKDASSSLPEVMTNTDILTFFFREQKKDILKIKDSLATAIYEYCFIMKKGGAKTVTDKQAESTVAFLEKIIKAGNATGEFDVSNPKKCARNMTYIFEGLKILSRSGTVTEKMIDDEIVWILEDILPKK